MIYEVLKDSAPAAFLYKLSVSNKIKIHIQHTVKKHFNFYRMTGNNIHPISKAEQNKVGGDSTAQGMVCFKWQFLIMLSYQRTTTLKGRKTESKTKQQQVYQEGRMKPAFLSSLGAVTSSLLG